MNKSRVLTIIYIVIAATITFVVYKIITADNIILQGDNSETILFDENSLWEDPENASSEYNSGTEETDSRKSVQTESTQQSKQSSKKSSSKSSSKKTSSKKTSSRKTSSKKVSSKKVSSKVSSKTSSKVLSSDTSSKQSSEESDDTVTSVEYGIININTADIDALCSLPGIGESLAKRIIEFRENSGEFTAIEEIMYVSGIGEAKFDAIKDLITVE